MKEIIDSLGFRNVKLALSVLTLIDKHFDNHFDIADNAR
jgi:hypothetical protein